MKSFKITIWEYSNELFSNNYVFKSKKEAYIFAIGIKVGLQFAYKSTIKFTVEENKQSDEIDAIYRVANVEPNKQ